MSGTLWIRQKSRPGKRACEFVTALSPEVYGIKCQSSGSVSLSSLISRGMIPGTGMIKKIIACNVQNSGRSLKKSLFQRL